MASSSSYVIQPKEIIRGLSTINGTADRVDMGEDQIDSILRKVRVAFYMIVFDISKIIVMGAANLNAGRDVILLTRPTCFKLDSPGEIDEGIGKVAFVEVAVNRTLGTCNLR